MSKFEHQSTWIEKDKLSLDIFIGSKSNYCIHVIDYEYESAIEVFCGNNLDRAKSVYTALINILRS